MSNLPSFTLPEWQTMHLFSKIGSISFAYSTGSFRFRSTVGIGGRSLASFFGSWVCDSARPPGRRDKHAGTSERMGNSG